MIWRQTPAKLHPQLRRHHPIFIRSGHSVVGWYENKSHRSLCSDETRETNDQWTMNRKIPFCVSLLLIFFRKDAKLSRFSDEREKFHRFSTHKKRTNFYGRWMNKIFHSIPKRKWWNDKLYWSAQYLSCDSWKIFFFLFRYRSSTRWDFCCFYRSMNIDCLILFKKNISHRFKDQDQPQGGLQWTFFQQHNDFPREKFLCHRLFLFYIFFSEGIAALRDEFSSFIVRMP